jgi:N-acetylneuraminic acid mutarotase
MCGQPGVYGTLGTPAVGNTPGARYGASSWTDIHGNLWLFGGYGFNALGKDVGLNDLWEFNPATSQWTWMGESSTAYQPGVYGALGEPAAGNIPESRNSAVSWTDQKGNFWLFGGEGIDANGYYFGFLNDLWEFNPSTNEWAWMGGSNTVGNNCQTYSSLTLCGQPGVYGTLGSPETGNIPGGRWNGVNWIDGSGNF